MANILLSFAVFTFSIWAIFSIHIFATSNGTLGYLGDVVDNGRFTDGTPLIPITTNGKYPILDWQIKAPTAFLWSFGNGAHPDNSLAGLLFAGAWASSWILIILEGFRRCNRRKIISFISVWGFFQFNHSNALITPIWLAVHLVTSPSAAKPTATDISIDPIHLLALPASIIIGFVLPMVPVVLPFSLVSLKIKQTAMGWYQQWPLWIAVLHYTLVALLRFSSLPSKLEPPEIRLILYRSVYIFAFAFAIFTHLPVMSLSFAASVWPSLFNEEYAYLLRPNHLLVPKNPFMDAKAKNLAEGMLWLIQWDYFSGYLAPAVWAIFLRRKVEETPHRSDSLVYCLIRAVLYLLVAGPVGIAIGMVWERDEILLGVDRSTREAKSNILNQGHLKR